ncbi:MAG: flotillin-like FloA family protein [Planctomycetota bacterium]
MYIFANFFFLLGPGTILLGLVLLLLSAYLLFLTVISLPAYIASKRQAAGLSLIQILVMSAQGIDAKVLVNTLEIASEHGLDIPMKEAKAFHLTGIDIVCVAMAMAEGSKFGVKLSFAELAKIALSGQDLDQFITSQRELL